MRFLKGFLMYNFFTLFVFILVYNGVKTEITQRNKVYGMEILLHEYQAITLTVLYILMNIVFILLYVYVRREENRGGLDEEEV